MTRPEFMRTRTTSPKFQLFQLQTTGARVRVSLRAASRLRQRRLFQLAATKLEIRQLTTELGRRCGGGGFKSLKLL
ncbi:hypothetical protein HanPI659440_Chr06g0228501 [Helianthus annuus]|nr:hypothetical protein HanPI659440_Chr06g0228501 [Helianthus annuus]